MFIGMGMPIPDLSNLPGPSRPGGGGSAFEYTAIDNSFSMEFDGVSSYYDLGNIDSISNVSQFTISTWINPNTIAGSDKEIFTTANSTSESIVLNLFNADLILGVGTTSQFNRYNSAVVANQWYHILMVYDGSESTNSDRIKLYKNGVLQTPSSTSGTIPTTTPTITSNAYIGSWAISPPTAIFDGNIDEVAIWIVTGKLHFYIT